MQSIDIVDHNNITIIIVFYDVISVHRLYNLKILNRHTDKKSKVDCPCSVSISFRL